MLHSILSPTAAISVAAILFASVAHKLNAPHRFARQLQDYELLPSVAVSPVARGLPWLEFGAAVALLIPIVRVYGAVLAASLLVLYSGAIACNLIRGRRDIACGCSGPGLERPLSGALIIRNIVLVGLLCITALPVDGAAHTGPELLLVTVTAVTGLIIYTAIEGLLTNSTRLKSLEGK